MLLLFLLFLLALLSLLLLLLLLLLTDGPLAPAHVKVRLVRQRKVVQRTCSGTDSSIMLTDCSSLGHSAVLG
jgi:hypothetical protein